MAVFQVKCGVYRSRGQIHKRGSFVESDKDLIECFPGKFILVDEGPTEMRPKIPVVSTSPSEPTGDSPERGSPVDTPRKKLKDLQIKPKSKPKPKEEEKEEETSFEAWDDLTEEFSKAEGLGVSVLYNGSMYRVFDIEAGKVLSEDEKLKKSKDVKLFLKKLKEE
jgi:hypothetical protein